MNCYSSSRPLCLPFDQSDPLVSGVKRKIKWSAAYLKELTAPEPTDLPQPPALPSQSRLFGAVKTLVWTAASIGIGTLLATVCR